MLFSLMSSPFGIGVLAADQIPSLDHHRIVPFETVPFYASHNASINGNFMIPFIKTPILQIPSNNAAIINNTLLTLDEKPIHQQVNNKKSFALENLINGTPTANKDTGNMRKRNLFRIDDILAHICADKEQKLDATDDHFRSNSPIISTHIDDVILNTHEQDSSVVSKKEELIHPPSPSEISSINAEAPHNLPSDSVPLLTVADPSLLSDICGIKSADSTLSSPNDSTETVVDMDTLPCLDSFKERPITPLTPSLDPDFLKRLEEEDMPKRVLRSSTVALTRNSKDHAVKRVIRTKDTSRCSSVSSTPRKRRIKRSKGTRRTTKKQNKTLFASTSNEQYGPIEVKINDDLTSGPCAPSSSGLSSISSGSSYASYRSRGGRRRRRTKIVVSNWKPICSGSRQYVYFNNDVSPVKRVCYKAVRHVREPETLHVRDSVVVKAFDGTFNYGKVTRIFLNEDSGILMASVLWYYNKDQIETDPTAIHPPIAEKELFASRHIDVVPLDTIEEIIFVVTLNEYARYMAENKIDALPRSQRPREEDEVWPRGELGYPRRSLLPCEDTPIELVYFCRRMYDFKQKKITTNKPITSRKLLAARRYTHRTSH